MKTKAERELTKHLSALVKAVEAHLSALDAEMRLPSSNERGMRIARICNTLEVAKERVRFSATGLNVDFRTGKRA